MCIVQLNCQMFRQGIKCAELRPVFLQTVCKRCGTEEILLFQAEQLAGIGAVIGIENTGNILGTVFPFERFIEFLLVKQFKVKVINRFRLPKP